MTVYFKEQNKYVVDTTFMHIIVKRVYDIDMKRECILFYYRAVNAVARVQIMYELMDAGFQRYDTTPAYSLWYIP